MEFYVMQLKNQGLKFDHSTTLSRERKLLEAENRIIALKNENSLLREKLTAVEKKLECVRKRVFDTERFKCDENISFYTGFPDFNMCVFISALVNMGIRNRLEDQPSVGNFIGCIGDASPQSN